MIRVDLAFLIGFFFGALLLGVLMVWIFSWRDDQGREEGTGEDCCVKRCPYCGHSFVDYLMREVAVCPLCKSYMEAGHNVKKYG